jgi:hypothetical protein
VDTSSLADINMILDDLTNFTKTLIA